MASKNKITDYTNKGTLESSDEFLLQDSGGYKKTTFASFLIDTLQSVYNRGKQILVTDTADGALKIKDSNTNTNRDNIIEILDKDDNVVFAVDKNGPVGSAVTSGVYIPTFTNQNANVDTITHYKSFYQQIGNVVRVTSFLYLTTNTGFTIAEWNMSLPIASSLSTTINLFGKGYYNMGSDYINVSGDSINDNAFITFNAGSTAGFVQLDFTYLIE